MGLFDLFRRAPTYHHPAIGAMRRESNNSWRASQAKVPIAETPMDVYLAGDLQGPSKAAVNGLAALTSEPKLARSLVEETLYELWQNYFSEEVPPAALACPQEIWGTEEWVALNVAGERSFAITFSFNWQHPDDCNLVTVYVENGTVTGSSIDG